MACLGLDLAGYQQLEPRLRQEVDDWLRRAAPPHVADNCYAFQVVEDGVCFGHYLLDASGRRFVDRELGAAARAWTKIDRCELPPASVLRERR